MAINYNEIALNDWQELINNFETLDHYLLLTIGNGSEYLYKSVNDNIDLLDDIYIIDLIEIMFDSEYNTIERDLKDHFINQLLTTQNYKLQDLKHSIRLYFEN